MKQITARAAFITNRNGNAVANHTVITTYDENDVALTRCFQSFSSIVCVYDYRTESMTFGRDWDYSNTTMRHLNEFLRHHVPFGYIIGDRVSGSVCAATVRKAIRDGVVEYDPELV